MKKAVVKIGGKQYIVAEKETLRVDLLPEGTKELEMDALLVIDGEKTEVGTPAVKGVKVKAKVAEPEVKGDKTTVGTPTVKGVKVSAKVITPEVKGDKVRVIRYHSKKRVHKETGHRQKYSLIEITSIK